MRSPLRSSLVICLALLPLATAKAAGSYAFDGSQAVIEYGDPPALELADALTICAWVRSDHAQRQQIIAGKSANSGHTDPYLEFGFSQGSGAPHQVTFGLSTGGAGSLALARSAGGPNLTEWTWVCAAWDRSQDGGKLEIHLNGAETPAYAETAFATAPILAGEEYFRIGRTAASSEAWDGKLAYLHLWNRKLTGGEIAEVMFHPGARRRGLVLFVPLNSDISFPHTPVLDDFNRADGLIGGYDPSPTDWTHNFLLPAGEVFLSIESGQARSPGASDAGSETWNRFAGLNQEAYFRLTALQTGSRCNNLVARLRTIDEQERSDQYICELCVQTGADTIQAQKRTDNGTDFNDTLLSARNSVAEYAPGDVLGIRVVGGRVECLVNGVVKAAGFDSSPHPHPGHVALFLTDSPTVRGDDFGGGNYNAIRDLSGNALHTSAAGLQYSFDSPPIAGTAR